MPDAESRHRQIEVLGRRGGHSVQEAEEKIGESETIHK